jgi:alpha-tubulin suppressor-like RCC1 family protein
MNSKALLVVIVAVFGLVACQQPAVPPTNVVLDRAVSSGGALRAQGIGGIAAIFAGGNHTCGLTVAGGVKCWGDVTYSLAPFDINGLSSGVLMASPGGSHYCVLTNLGGVKCWGYNSSGELGNNTLTYGYNPESVIDLSSGVKEIASGDGHTCALTVEGGVKCWGSNAFGQLGNGSRTSSLVPVDVVGLSNSVKSISGNGFYTCAITSADGVKCWGNNARGQLGDPSLNSSFSQVPVDVSGLTSGVRAIAAGGLHACALTAAGGVKCWGWNLQGALGNNTTTNSTSPVDVTGLSGGVQAIVVGDGHSCALTVEGGVKCWGWNYSGALGNGSYSSSSIPVSVTELSGGVQAITAGNHHTCGVISSGGAKCWGDNSSGQLGINSKISSNVPVSVINFDSGPSDTTPPTITPTITGTLGSNGWYSSDVTVSWAVVDNESAISSSSHCETVTFNTDAETMINCSASSDGGTSSQAVTIKRDATKPSLNPLITPNPVVLNAVASITPGAADALSGLASSGCGMLNTSSVGAKVVTCNATDNAGNSSSVNAGYQVVYSFRGFLNPASPPSQNVFKAGSAIKLKFALGASAAPVALSASTGLAASSVSTVSKSSGNFGRNIISSLKSVQIDCSSLNLIGSPLPAQSELEFDDGQYKLEWTTQKAWKGSCRQLLMTLNDGTTHPANFQFL